MTAPVICAAGECDVVLSDEDSFLHIRSAPDLRSRAMGAVPGWGAKVETLGPTEEVGNRTWYQIRFAGVEGWVSGEYLKCGPTE